MQQVNLRELYPNVYNTDIFVEVTDEVQTVFLADKKAQEARERQMYRYKAFYSLDSNDGIENLVIQHPMTPDEILEEKQLRNNSILR